MAGVLQEAAGALLSPGVPFLFIIRAGLGSEDVACRQAHHCRWCWLDNQIQSGKKTTGKEGKTAAE